ASVPPAGDGAATEKLREEIRNEIICDRATGAGDYSEAEEYANRIVGKAAPSDTQNPENKSGSGLLLDALSMAPDSVGSVAPTEGREPTAKLRELVIRKDEAEMMLQIFENWPTTASTRRALQQHIAGLSIKISEAEAAL